MDIEVEVRSFISEDQYNNLLTFMQKNAKLIKKDNQITFYFSGEDDLRIQKNDFFSISKHRDFALPVRAPG